MHFSHALAVLALTATTAMANANVADLDSRAVSPIGASLFQRDLPAPIRKLERWASAHGYAVRLRKVHRHKKTSASKKAALARKKKAAAAAASKKASATRKPKPTHTAASTKKPATKTTVAPTSTKAAATTTKTPAATSKPISAAVSAVQSEMLSVHNNLRAKHGAVDLTWSSTLASAAQKWADKCVFKHSGGAVGSYGENIAAGYGTATSAAQAWANEEKDYDPSNPQYSHFTQMVWKGTTQLGCAVANCNGIIQAGLTQPFYVCEYNPPGNVIGQFDQNVQA